MKSIQNQYRDLKEGKMSQANFMRNLRMAMPQYVTNTTSFGDAVRILKNKAILTESFFDEIKVLTKKEVFNPAQDAANAAYTSPADRMYNSDEWVKAQKDAEGGDDEDAEFDAMIKQIEDEMYGERVTKSDVLDEPLEESLTEGKGKELHPNQIHPAELRMGIKVELEHTDELDKAKKIALDHLAENPFYYTALKLSGIESPSAPKVKEPKEKKAKKETIQLVDLVNGMKKVKMPKAEKKKLKETVDEKMQFQDLPADPEIYKTVRDSKGKIIKATNADGVEFQRGDEVTAVDNDEKIKIDSFKEEQGKIKALYNVGMFFKSIDIDGLNAPKEIIKPGVNLGASFEKFKKSLEEIVHEVVNETFDGRDNLIDPLASEEENK